MKMTEYKVSRQNAIGGRNSVGWLLKWKIGDKWIKSPGYVLRYMYDSIGEALAYEASKDIGISGHLKYKLCIINIDGVRVIGCESEDFVPGGLKEVTLFKLIELGYIRQVGTGKRLYEDIISQIKDLFNLDIRRVLEDTILLDSLILNSDRNLWNISILVDNKMQGYECPIYDSGCSFGLHTFKEGSISNEEIYMQGYRCEPFEEYYEDQIKYIRDSRKYRSTDFSRAMKLVRWLNEHCTLDNNEYGVINALTRGQIEHITSILKIRSSIVRNKEWIG